MVAPNKTSKRKLTRSKRKRTRVAFWAVCLAVLLVLGLLGWLGWMPIQAYYFAIGAAAFLLARLTWGWGWAYMLRAVGLGQRPVNPVGRKETHRLLRGAKPRPMNPLERKEYRRAVRRATRVSR